VGCKLKIRRNRYDYFDETLIIKLPFIHHEIMPALLTRLAKSDHMARLTFGKDGDVLQAGSAFINLGKGSKKCPDESFYDSKSPKGLPESKFPTIVFEVGLSETQNKLNHDAARILTGSNGLVLTVVTIKISVSPFEGGGNGKQLDSVVVYFWSMHIADPERLPDPASKKRRETARYLGVLCDNSGEPVTVSTCPESVQMNQAISEDMFCQYSIRPSHTFDVSC